MKMTSSQLIYQNELSKYEKLKVQFEELKISLQKQHEEVVRREYESKHPLIVNIESYLPLVLALQCLSYCPEKYCAVCKRFYLSNRCFCNGKKDLVYNLQGDMKLVCTHYEYPYGQLRKFFLPTAENDRQLLNEWKQHGYEYRNRMSNQMELRPHCCFYQELHNNCFLYLSQQKSFIEAGSRITLSEVSNDNNIVMIDA